MCCQVDCGLTAKLYDRRVRLLSVDNALNVLGRQRLEVQTISGVKVGGNGLRVVVDDNGLTAQLLECPDRVNRAVVELDTLTDTDGTGAQNQYLLLTGRRLDLVFVVEGRVVVRGLSVELCCTGINRLVDRQALERTDLLTGQLLDGLVEEAHLLRAQVQLLIQLGSLSQLVLHVYNVLVAVQEPGVDHGDVVNLVDGHDAAAQCLADDQQTLVVDLSNTGLDFLIRPSLELGHDKAVQLHLNAADGLHHRLLKGRCNRHDLTGRLHLGAERVVCVNELIKRPARELGDNIVEGRLEASVGLAGDRVHDLVQTVADCDLSGNLCDRETGRLGCQRGRTGNTGVYLDNCVLERVRVQCVLYVTATLDAQLGDDVERRGAQHLVFLVGQGLAGCDNDRVTGVYANRVNVLHVTDGDGVALAVAHDLILDFLPACDALLDQNLVDTRVHNTGRSDLAQLLPGVRDTAAGTAQSVCRTDDDRQTDLLGECNRILDRVYDLGSDARLADLLHGVLEHLAVFGLSDGVRVCAQQLNAVLVEETVSGQVHCQVQTGLTAEVGDQGVRTLFLDDFLDRVQGHRLNIYLVSHGLIGHDGCRVGVYQNDLQTLFTQGAACLSACVVELGRLTDDDGAGAQYHDFVDIFSQRH